MDYFFSSNPGPGDEDDDDDDSLIPIERDDDDDLLGDDDDDDLLGDDDDDDINTRNISDLGSGFSDRSNGRRTGRMIDHEPGITDND